MSFFTNKLKETRNFLASHQQAIFILNTLAFAAAAQDWYENTQEDGKASEASADLIAHAFTMLSLSCAATSQTALAALMLNAGRLGAIYAGVTSGSTCPPLAVNLADAVNHVVSMVTLLGKDSTQEETSNVEQRPLQGR